MSAVCDDGHVTDALPSPDTLELPVGTIAYRRSGGTGPRLLLVHGNSASSATFAAQLTGEFGATHDVVALDLPGHGGSVRLGDPAAYTLNTHVNVIAGVLVTLGWDDAVVVGWSLGGHLVLQSLPDLPAAGVAIFGTPPLGSPPAMEDAFLPEPAMGVGFTPEVDEPAALSYAEAFLAPGSTIDAGLFTPDILGTDGAARAGIAMAIGAGGLSDEREVVRSLDRPLAVLHGAGERLVNGDYVAAVAAEAPTLWRDAVQVIDGAGHTPHVEAPTEFNALLAAFAAEVG